MSVATRPAADDFAAIRARLRELRRVGSQSAHRAILAKEPALPLEAPHEATGGGGATECYRQHVMDEIKRRLYEIARRGQ